MVLTARLDEHALGPDASLFVGVNDLVGPTTDAATLKDRFSTPTETARRSALAAVTRKVAALPSSPCQCFVDNIPVLGSVDSVQDDRGIRRSVYRLKTRHCAKIARVGDHRRHYA